MGNLLMVRILLIRFQTVSTFCICFSALIENDELFYYYLLLMRVFQGIGGISVLTASYSLISIEFSDGKEKFFGYAEACIGIGLMMGPVLGSAIYSLSDYFVTNFVFGMIFLVCTFAVMFLLPERLNIDGIKIDEVSSVSNSGSN